MEKYKIKYKKKNLEIELRKEKYLKLIMIFFVNIVTYKSTFKFTSINYFSK